MRVFLPRPWFSVLARLCLLAALWTQHSGAGVLPQAVALQAAQLRAQIEPLRSGWEYTPGDLLPGESPAPGRDWELLAQPWWTPGQFPRQGWPGRATFRLSLDVDPLLVGQPLALMLEHLGASEVYLDGHLLQRYGSVRASSFESWNPQREPLPLLFTSAGLHELCVRYAGPALQDGGWLAQWWVASQAAGARVPLGIHVWIGMHAEALQQAEQRRGRTWGKLAFLLGVLGTGLLLHLTLYYFNRSDRTFLYAGLLAAFMALLCACTYVTATGHLGLEEWVAVAVVAGQARALIASALLLFLAEVCQVRWRKVIWCMCALLIAAELVFFVPEVTRLFETVLLSCELAAASLCGIMVYAGWRRCVPSLWPLAMATLCVTLARFSVVLVWWKVVPGPTAGVSNNTLLVSFVLLLGVYLARRVGDYARQLRALNELLEQKVVQRTEELAHSEQRAHLANEAKSRFLASMSHEIRTPMNGVMGISELLLQESMTPRQRTYVEMMRASAGGLLSIINEILDLSKVEAGQVVLEQEPFSLRACVQQSLDVVAPEAHRKQLVLQASIAPEIGDRWSGAPVRLRQILINLLGNGVKYTQSGHVTLAIDALPPSGETKWASKDCMTMRFSVTDSGIGLPPGTEQKLFSPFYQGATPHTARVKGTGLGLSISRQLVELMGGRIWAENLGGGGARFCMELTFAKAPEAEGEPLGSRDPDGGPEQQDAGVPTITRVLVADDNAVNRIVTSHLIRKLGPEADLAEDGEQVMARLKQRRYDLILMDVQMPLLDGLEATKRIVSTYGAAKPRIIGLTASAFPEDRAACLEAGMDGFLSKPVSLAELRQAIAAVGVVGSADDDARAAGKPEQTPVVTLKM